MVDLDLLLEWFDVDTEAGIVRWKKTRQIGRQKPEILRGRVAAAIGELSYAGLFGVDDTASLCTVSFGRFTMANGQKMKSTIKTSMGSRTASATSANALTHRMGATLKSERTIRRDLRAFIVTVIASAPE